ncbi:hypothetical protein SNE40_002041 [Patella caerulea]|uniref:small monomeric GTPase n=1 Tax=Patella caerulea TaxID=87958 RepID=A0AAN8JSK0_PATCE
MWCGSTKSTGRQRLRSDSECSSYDEEYKIVVVGSADVGKTALCQCFVNVEDNQRQNLQKASKGRRAEFNTWEAVDGDTCCIRLFELRMSAQGDDDEQIVKSLTQGADGFLLIYSICDMGSFQATIKVNSILQKLRGNIETPLVLVGNKADGMSGRQVTVSCGRDLAFDLGSAFYETSRYFDSHHITNIFHDVIRQVRCVRTRTKFQEQTFTKVRGFIHRLSFKGKRKSLKSAPTS